MKKICPHCGSIDVKVNSKIGECLDLHCGHIAPAVKFKPVPAMLDSGNKHWRDPVAMSMDGYN